MKDKVWVIVTIVFIFLVWFLIERELIKRDECQMLRKQMEQTTVDAITGRLLLESKWFDANCLKP